MTRHDVSGALKMLGAEHAPEPTDEFVDGLAHTLRVAGLRRVVAAQARRRSPVARFGFAFATAVVLAAAVAIVLTRGPSEQSPSMMMLASSTDAVVVYPDGRIVEASDGLTVPNGTAIRTGPAGRVVADGKVLGPQREARVERGRLVGERSRAGQTLPPASPADVKPARPATKPPAPAPSTQPVRPVAPEPKPTADVRPAPSERPPAAGLALACKPTDRRAVQCRWTPTDHPAFAAYVLVRADGTQRREVFRTRDRGQTGFIDADVATGHTYDYKVQAVDAAGNVIASGGPARVTVP